MFKELATSRRFAPLFWCQLCSALNDNFLKNALVMLILYGLGGAGSAVGESGPTLVTLAGVVFIAPFFILSALGGELADRYDKAQVAANIKLAEIPIAGLAAVGFYLHSVTILFVTLGLFGIVAALFGPVKYGILPEKLKTAELPAGNAMVEGATFLAILAGTIAGGIAVKSASTPVLVVAVIVALAVVSWLFARAIPVAGPAAPNLAITRNPWNSTVALLRDLRKDARLWSGGHIVSWFWLVGAVALSLLPVVVKDDIGGNEDVAILGIATFVIGISVGSGVAAYASHGTPNLALVPLGAGLMALFSLVIALLSGLMTPGAESIGPSAVLGTCRRPVVPRRTMWACRGRRAVHRAGVRRGAGVVAPGGAGARHCRGQRHERGLYGGRRRHCGGLAGARREPRTAVRGARRPEPRRPPLRAAGVGGRGARPACAQGLGGRRGGELQGEC